MFVAEKVLLLLVISLTGYGAYNVVSTLVKKVGTTSDLHTVAVRAMANLDHSAKHS